MNPNNPPPRTDHARRYAMNELRMIFDNRVKSYFALIGNHGTDGAWNRFISSNHGQRWLRTIYDRITHDPPAYTPIQAINEDLNDYMTYLRTTTRDRLFNIFFNILRTLNPDIDRIRIRSLFDSFENEYQITGEDLFEDIISGMVYNVITNDDIRNEISAFLMRESARRFQEGEFVSIPKKRKTK